MRASCFEDEAHVWRPLRHEGFVYEGRQRSLEPGGRARLNFVKPGEEAAATELQPATLQGEHVRLEPLTLDHVDEMAAFALDPELWKWVPNRVTTTKELREYVLDALRDEARGISLPVAVIDQATGAVCGCTRLGSLAENHRRGEIGWTFYAKASQRTASNTETKLLLLTRAFETFGLERVELKTDSMNARSRAAILRLGATEEGTLRSHITCWDGRRRDTVYHSIVRAEWPAIRSSLRDRLER